jgi:hypothetical protein
MQIIDLYTLVQRTTCKVDEVFCFLQAGPPSIKTPMVGVVLAFAPFFWPISEGFGRKVNEKQA